MNDWVFKNVPFLDSTRILVIELCTQTGDQQEALLMKRMLRLPSFIRQPAGGYSIASRGQPKLLPVV